MERMVVILGFMNPLVMVICKPIIKTSKHNFKTHTKRTLPIIRYYINTLKKITFGCSICAANMWLVPLHLSVSGCQESGSVVANDAAKYTFTFIFLKVFLLHPSIKKKSFFRGFLCSTRWPLSTDLQAKKHEKKKESGGRKKITSSGTSFARYRYLFFLLEWRKGSLSIL